MILPAPSEGTQAQRRSLKTMKVAAAASVICALAVVAFLSLNAHGPNLGFVLAAQSLGIASAASAAVAVTAGFWHVRTARPDLRRPAGFLAVLTLGVLLAHLYVVNSPPAATNSTLSGPVGQTFQDSHIRVSSQVSATRLTVRIVNVGSNANGSFNAIGEVSLSLGGQALSASNLSPEPSYQTPLQPQSSSSLGFPVDATGTWSVTAPAASQLTVSYQFLTCYHVPTSTDPRGVFGCIMDESYYVPSALGILSGAQCAPYADSCNLEHPPLAKAFIAAGVSVLGLNDLGYRFSEVLLGTLSVPLVFVLVQLLSGERRLAYFSALIFAADPMFFVHSSAALIDVPGVFFSLLGFILYLRPGRFWKLNNYVASGVLFGLAALSKETALFALLALLTYELLFGEGRWRSSVLKLFEVAVPAVLVFAGAVQLFDSLFTSAALPWFYQQVQFMLTYGVGLKNGGWCLGASPCPNGPFITPLNWLTFSPPVSYLVISVSSAAGSYVSVGYYGVASPAIVWMAYLWIPVGLYPLLKERQWRSDVGRERRFAGFMVIWFLWSYVPYLALWAYGRVTYPFYILPAMPALASGAAYFLTRPFFPRKMAVIYVLAVFTIFLLYYPVKDFLPMPVRAILGH